MATASDFYEDDEPVEEIRARFERGDKGLTARPVRGKTEYLDLNRSETSTPNQTSGELVDH